MNILVVVPAGISVNFLVLGGLVLSVLVFFGVVWAIRRMLLLLNRS